MSLRPSTQARLGVALLTFAAFGAFAWWLSPARLPVEAAFVFDRPLPDALDALIGPYRVAVVTPLSVAGARPTTGAIQALRFAPGSTAVTTAHTTTRQTVYYPDPAAARRVLAPRRAEIGGWRLVKVTVAEAPEVWFAQAAWRSLVGDGQVEDPRPEAFFLVATDARGRVRHVSPAMRCAPPVQAGTGPT